MYSAPSEALSIERRLVESATTLTASATRSLAAFQLVNEGVCRINNVVSASMCSELREHVLQMSQDRATKNASVQDLRNIPGTRLRFSEAIPLPLNQRTDLLLPIEDTIVNSVLQKLASELGATLEAGAEILPGVKSRDRNGVLELELVEAACLISETGATNQNLHADFRRDDPNAEVRLPPRLVTFLYVQDTPTVSHGPTIFVPNTNNQVSHSSYFRDSGSLDTSLARCATLCAGDVAIYDASVLHFGSANSVPGNRRVVLYFGVGLKNSAALVSNDSSIKLENLEPISLVTTSNGVKRFAHVSVRGMEQI